MVEPQTSSISVLVTSVGSNTAISVVKALRQSNTFVQIVGIDTNPRHLCSGAALVDFFYTVPGCNDKMAYLTAVRELIERHAIICLIPIHDLEIALLAFENDRSNLNSFVAVSPFSVVEICNDKLKATEAARAVGLPVPLIFGSPDQFRFPLIRKPIRGVSSVGITVFDDQNDYVNAKIGTNVFHQEFIQGIEYTVDTYSTRNGNFYGGVVRQRIETKAGISTKGITVRNDVLLDHCRKLLNHLNYKGAANIQFIERNGEYYFIEINPRFSGAGILSYQAGFNSPEFSILEARGFPLPEFSHQKIAYNLCMTRYWQESFYQVNL